MRGHRTDGEGGRAAPAATRQRVARLADPRLWGGAVLITVSAVLGAALLSGGADTVTVWQATRDLSVGARPVDVEPVEVDRAIAAGRYAGPDAPATGVLQRPVAAGELVPAAALGPAAATPTRRVTVPVDPLHAPPVLVPGDVVDVWASPREPEGTGAAPALVLADALVADVSADSTGLGGELGVVLDVPLERVPEVVRATRAGVVDLVAVPVSSQGSAA